MSDISKEIEEMAVVIVVVGVFLLGLLGGFIIGVKCESSDWKTEMVKRNHAEWIVRQDGSTQFKWKEAKP